MEPEAARSKNDHRVVAESWNQNDQCAQSSDGIRIILESYADVINERGSYSEEQDERHRYGAVRSSIHSDPIHESDLSSEEEPSDNVIRVTVNRIELLVHHGLGNGNAFSLVMTGSVQLVDGSAFIDVSFFSI
jgi:hypothetical protein